MHWGKIDLKMKRPTKSFRNSQCTDTCGKSKVPTILASVTFICLVDYIKGIVYFHTLIFKI